MYPASTVAAVIAILREEASHPVQSERREPTVRTLPHIQRLAWQLAQPLH